MERTRAAVDTVMMADAVGYSAPWYAPEDATYAATVAALPEARVDAGFPWAALQQRFPELARLRETPQDEVHHAEGNVAIHSEMVGDALVADPAWLALPRAEQLVLVLAAAFHDVGKWSTTRVDESTGRISSRGHARRGALDTRNALWEAGVPFAIREQVVALVRWHMRPAFLWTAEDPTRDVALLTQSARADLLTILARADTRGRISQDQEDALARVAIFHDHCVSADCVRTPFAFANARSRAQYFSTPGRDPHYAAYDDSWGEVTLLAGLPGAGKDSWLWAHARDLPVVSRDAFRDRLGLKRSETPGALLTAAKEAAKGFLRRRQPFAWNMTSLVRTRRAEQIALAHAYGARVRVVYVEVGIDQLARQSAARVHAVPAASLLKMRQGWEVPDATEAETLCYAVNEDWRYATGICLPVRSARVARGGPS
jgi:predicted kinase